MAKYVIISRMGSPFPKGTIFRKDDNGYERQMWTKKTKRPELVAASLILIPHEALNPFVTILNNPRKNPFVYENGRVYFREPDPVIIRI